METSIGSFALDLAAPLETAAGSIETREGFVITVEGDNGQVGVGEASPLPGWTESLSECRTALERAASALAAASADAVLADLDAAGDFDECPAARHGISEALLDLQARRDGIPLYQHLGADSKVESIPVNATIGDCGTDETAQRARNAADAGFDCIKVKVGVRSVSSDTDRLAAVREAVGPGVKLRADANGAWSHEQARRAITSFADLGVTYVEQPLEPADLAGHADLRGGSVGIALDESLAETSVGAVLEADAADVLICKPMVLGGLDRVQEVSTRAHEAGVEVVVTTTIDAVIARTGAVHLAASLGNLPACGLATAELLADDLASDPTPVEDGRIRVPQESGLGIQGVSNWS